VKPVKLSWGRFNREGDLTRWYYLISDEDLWGNPIVVKRWGCVYGRRKEKIEWLRGVEELRKVILRTEELMRQRGYQLTKQ